jgi:AAA15 family ATPase/GTPase
MAKQTKTNIKNLFLDPNNYRFIDNPEYELVEDSELTNSKIQDRSLDFLEKEGLRDLEDSFKKNGYLPVDIIQVREIEKGKFLVVEGNRRIATLKKLWKRYEKERNLNLGELNPSIFSSVPIVYYEDVKDENHHLVLMGLKHISGNRKWKAYNQALLIRKLQNSFKMSDDEIIKSLAISKQELVKILRTLTLIEDYQKSEFGDQFKSSMYSTFQILANAPKVKEFIKFSDDNYIEDRTNRDRLFSLLSDVEDIDDKTGDKIVKEKVISTSTEARNLANIIDDKKAVEEMEESRNFATSYAVSNKAQEDKVNSTLKRVEETFNEIDPKFLDRRAKERLGRISEKIRKIIYKNEENLFNELENDSEVFMNFKSKGLSKINIVKYKRLENLTLESLNRINIFGGINNSGKTSLLEAINFLINQNDSYNFLELQRRRGKFKRLNAKWLHSEFRESLEVNGTFNYAPISVKIWKEEEKSDSLDKNNYLSTFEFRSTFAEESLKSSIRLFSDRNEKFYTTMKVICNNSYSSPFSIQSKSLLEKYYARSFSKGTLKESLNFIKEHIDPNIEDIRFVKTPVETFQIESKDGTRDLSSYGDGLQRIFFITLQFASAENGVLLIDEIENGVHYTLLEKFTEFIQKLAIKLSVQVFITTHSKETIEAFINNGFENSDVSYNLVTQDIENKDVRVINYDAETLGDKLTQKLEVRGW